MPRENPNLASINTAASTWQPDESLADPPDRSPLQRLAAAGSRAVGVTRLAEAVARRRHSQFSILCYHRIGRGGVPVFSGLPAYLFEAQIRYLRKHYRIVSLSKMLCEMVERRPVPPSVVITFDDGYADLYTEAFPILRRYEVPATIFLTVGAIETGQVAWYDRVFVAFQVTSAREFVFPLQPSTRFPLGTPQERLRAAVAFISLVRTLPTSQQRTFCADLDSTVSLPSAALANRMLTWDQVRDMHANGVSFGAHTMTHPVVSCLDDAELPFELGESKRLLEQNLQSSAPDFAFPFGKSDECGPSAVVCLKQLGYRSAATTVEGLNDPGTDPFALRRTSLCEQRSLPMFAMLLARLFLSRDSSIGQQPSPAAVPSQHPAAAASSVRSRTGAPRA